MILLRINWRLFFSFSVASTALNNISWGLGEPGKQHLNAQPEGSVGRSGEILFHHLRGMSFIWLDMTSAQTASPWIAFRQAEEQKVLFFFGFVTHLLLKVGQMNVVLKLCVFLMGFMGSLRWVTAVLPMVFGWFLGFWGQVRWISPSELKNCRHQVWAWRNWQNFLIYFYTPKLIRERSWGVILNDVGVIYHYGKWETVESNVYNKNINEQMPTGGWNRQ